MGLMWHESDTEEEIATRKIHRFSRRTVLALLVLFGMMMAAALSLGSSAHLGLWRKLLLWAMPVWALVVGAYALRAYWQARRYSKQKSSELGLTDTLTGLPNRKGLVAALERYELGPQEFGKRIRLVDVDLANLNRVNYEFGQMVGDAVLQDIANLIRDAVPEDHIVGRLGGDEFLVVLPHASVSEGESLAETLQQVISDYRLSLGERGEVHSLKARVSVADYIPEQASLHETVVSAKEATAHGKLPEAEGDETEAYYHVPRVTLGTFATNRWQNLTKSQQEAFKLWKRELSDSVTETMCSDMIKLLDEKAETNWVDFVTAVPAPGGAGGGRTYPARQLAEAVARQLGVPYRDVMRADSSGPENRSIEPAVDAVIDKGEGALLISDVISSGIVERRCVKKLSAAGAHVQVVAWAAY